MLDIKPWVLAGFIDTVLPDYAEFERRQKNSPSYSEVQPLISIKTVPKRSPPVVSKSIDHTLRAAANAMLLPHKMQRRVVIPQAKEFAKVVRGTFQSPEATVNAYFRAPQIANLGQGPLIVTDVTPAALSVSYAGNWTALEVHSDRSSDRRIITASGLTVDDELNLLAEPVKEMTYVLTQINRKKAERIANALEYIVERFEQEQILAEDKKLKYYTIIEDVRGNIIWDVVKTTGCMILRHLGLELAF